MQQYNNQRILMHMQNIERGSQAPNRNILRTFAVSAMAALAIATGPPHSSADAAVQTEGIADCAPYFRTARYKNHEYEVCTAYIQNSAGIALQGFYKFGNNSRSYLSDAVRHHFETRFWGGPRQSAENEVDSWPITKQLSGNKVENHIKLVSLKSNLKANRAFVRTRESWEVSSKGNTLHDEPEHTVNITMCRVKLPGHPLHAWVVALEERDPNIDCKDFAQNNGLEP